MAEEFEVVCFEMYGCRMGLLLGQLAGMTTEADALAMGYTLKPLHETLSFRHAQTGEPYKDSTAIVARRQQGHAALVVDEAHGIEPIALDAMRPMPALLHMANSAVFAAVLEEGQAPRFLIDLDKLLARHST